MAIIVNIDEAARQNTRYNILHEAIVKLMQDTDEAFQKEDPVDMIFCKGTIDRFQQTYSSNIGFDSVFEETGDYAQGPISNTDEGFSVTFTTRTWEGGFIISLQTLEDGNVGQISQDARDFIVAWDRQKVKMCLKSLEGAFGEDAIVKTKNKTSRFRLLSADTVDGNIRTQTKNPLFSNKHTIVKREDKTYNFNAVVDMKGRDSAGHASDAQSNLFYVADGDLQIGGDDPGQIPKLADIIRQVIAMQENYKDDNGEYTGVLGRKRIVSCNDPHLKAAINMALSEDSFKYGESMRPNEAKDAAEYKTSPYYNNIKPTADGKGFFIVDKAYNSANHGLEVTQRTERTIDVIDHTKESPRGIKHEGRERFDINNGTWRGIAYVRLGTPANTDEGWDKLANYTRVVPKATIVKTVKTI